MTDGTKKEPGDALIDRARKVLLSPNEEWSRIETEPVTTREVLIRYVVPLAAIGPVAAFLGGLAFESNAPGYRSSLLSPLSLAISTYVLSIAGIFVLSLLANFLAPRFDGRSDGLKAFKLIAYSATAAMVAGAFGIVPSLAFLWILGFYGIYLIYLGAGPLMRIPQDRAIGYTAVTAVGVIVVLFAISAVTRTIVGAFVPGPTYMSANGTATIPGVGKIDLGKAQQAANEMEAASRKPAVEPAKLQGLLPTQIAGYQRTAVEANGLGGVGSEASGTYEVGGKSFRLKVTDMSAMGAIAGIGSAMGVTRSREDADSYERTGTVDGRMQSERWNKTTNSGAFSVVVANRFMVEAEGSAASIVELKNAVASVDENALKRFAG